MSSSSYGDFRNRRQDGVWHILNRVMIILLFLAAIISVICWIWPVLKNRRAMREHKEQLVRNIESEKKLLSINKKKVDLLTNDPAYIETVARDRLDVMKEGETIFRLELPPESDKNDPNDPLKW